MDFHNGGINVFLLELDKRALERDPGRRYLEFEEKVLRI